MGLVSTEESLFSVFFFRSATKRRKQATSMGQTVRGA
jgi:hypothetical protein